MVQVLHTFEQEPRSRQSIKLSGGGGHRLRVEDYRIRYEIDDATKRVIVYRIKHRRLKFLATVREFGGLTSGRARMVYKTGPSSQPARFSTKGEALRYKRPCC
jgi:hypothetical protein